MKRLLIAVLFCAAAPFLYAADTFTFSNQPGPHGVGVKIVQQDDYTRQYKTRVDMTTGAPASGERACPIQALVWYPAVRGGKALTFRDYVETIPGEDDYGWGWQLDGLGEMQAKTGQPEAAVLSSMAKSRQGRRQADRRPSPAIPRPPRLHIAASFLS